MFAGELIDKAESLSNTIDELTVTIDHLTRTCEVIHKEAIQVLQEEQVLCLQALNRIRQQEVIING